MGHIYVIAFDSGTVKVGRAADAAKRLAKHRNEAARHGVTATTEWSSPPHTDDAETEQKLIQFCREHGTLQPGTSEYFVGLDFVAVREFAEQLVRGDRAVLVAPAKPNEARRTSTLQYGGIYETNDGAVLIVAAPGILAHPDRRWIPALEVKRHDDGDLLTVAIDIPGIGSRYVNAGNIQRILRDWIGTDLAAGSYIGTATADSMEVVRDTLAAVFDL